MKINSYSEFLIFQDRIINYIPIASTFVNLINIFQKCVINLNPKIAENNLYYRYLSRKSFSHCFVLLIPILGNIYVGIFSKKKPRRYMKIPLLYDFVELKKEMQNPKGLNKQEIHLPTIYVENKKPMGEKFVSEKEKILKDVGSIPIDYKNLDEKWKRDKDVAIAAVKANCYALKYFHNDLKNDKDVLLAALDRNLTVLQSIDDDLKKDRNFFFEVIKKVPILLRDAHQDLKDDKELVLAAVERNGNAIFHASDRLKKDRMVIDAAYRQNPASMKYAIL